MYRLTKLIVLTCLLALVGCDQLATQQADKTKFKLVKIQDLYQVALPDYMSVSKDLSEEASLQYQNLFKELYVVVLDEPWREFKETFESLGLYDDTLGVLDNYTNVQYESITEELTITSDVIRKSAKINGLPARIIQFDATVEDIDVPITYYYTFFQGPENVYLMLSWTLQTRREAYQSILEKMARSFKVSALENKAKK